MNTPAAKPAGAAKEPATPHTDLKEMIKKIVSKEASLKTKEDKIEMAKTLLQVFEKGKSPYQVMGFTEEEIAMIYFFGFKIFNAGQFKEALEVFKILLTIKPTTEYALALGTCYHKLKDYRNAATMYVVAIQGNPMDPVPYFYCYDCFMNMGNLYGAKSAISNAMDMAKQSKKYKKIEEKAALLLEGINEQLRKETENNGEKK